MYLTVQQKKEIFNFFVKVKKKKSHNTGCYEGNIATLTYRMKHISEYIKKNKRDFKTMKSLIEIVYKRKKLLKYIKNKKKYIFLHLRNELLK
jgi:small subunit ribosomal protein S15